METTKNLAVRRMNEAIEKGRALAIGGMEAMEREYKMRQDFRVKPEAFHPYVRAGQIEVTLGATQYKVNPWAQGQLLDAAWIPQAFAKRLLQNGEDALLQHNLATLIPKASKDGLFVRTVGPEIKAVLSPSYRPLDAAPIYAGFAQMALKSGLVPYQGMVSETRFFLSFIYPELFEIKQDEFVMLGLELRTSDYGRGALQLGICVIRAICVNGMIGMNLLRKVHLGRRFDQADLPDEGLVQVSQKTLTLDTATVRSALEDVVKGVKTQFGALVDVMKAHVTDTVDVRAMLDLLGKRGLSKAMQTQVETMYAAQLPVEAVPQEPGRWRFSNVISLLAKSTQGDEAKDLQDLAFEVMVPQKSLRN